MSDRARKAGFIKPIRRAEDSRAIRQMALELAGALFWFWSKRGLLGEGRFWLERALAANRHESRRLRARAFSGLANIAYFQ